MKKVGNIIAKAVLIICSAYIALLFGSSMFDTESSEITITTMSLRDSIPETIAPGVILAPEFESILAEDSRIESIANLPEISDSSVSTDFGSLDTELSETYALDTEPLDSIPDAPDDTLEACQVLRVVDVTSPVKNGSKATVSVVGKPNTEYSITVTYKTVSKASGLEPKISDSDGNVSWTWRVGANTTPGEHPIKIVGGAESVELSFVTYKE